MNGKYGKPLNDRVLVKLNEESDRKSSGGIIVNSMVDDVKKATVVAVSDGYYHQNGTYVNVSVKKDDVVLIPTNNTSYKIKIDGETFHLIRDSEILMIV